MPQTQTRPQPVVPFVHPQYHPQFGFAENVSANLDAQNATLVISNSLGSQDVTAISMVIAGLVKADVDANIDDCFELAKRNMANC